MRNNFQLRIDLKNIFDWHQSENKVPSQIEQNHNKNNFNMNDNTNIVLKG